MIAKLYIGHAWDALFGYRQKFVGEYLSHAAAMTAREAHANETGRDEAEYAIELNYETNSKQSSYR